MHLPRVRWSELLGVKRCMHFINISQERERKNIMILVFEVFIFTCPVLKGFQDYDMKTNQANEIYLHLIFLWFFLVKCIYSICFFVEWLRKEKVCWRQVYKREQMTIRQCCQVVSAGSEYTLVPSIWAKPAKNRTTKFREGTQKNVWILPCWWPSEQSNMTPSVNKRKGERVTS